MQYVTTYFKVWQNLLLPSKIVVVLRNYKTKSTCIMFSILFTYIVIFCFYLLYFSNFKSVLRHSAQRISSVNHGGNTTKRFFICLGRSSSQPLDGSIAILYKSSISDHIEQWSNLRQHIFKRLSDDFFFFLTLCWHFPHSLQISNIKRHRCISMTTPAFYICSSFNCMHSIQHIFFSFHLTIVFPAGLTLYHFLHFSIRLTSVTLPGCHGLRQMEGLGLMPPGGPNNLILLSIFVCICSGWIVSQLLD